MKKTKKVLSAVLACITLFGTSVTAFAASADKQYKYTDPSGEIIYYYLDDNGNPYNYQNDDKIYLALPLADLKVTDEDVIDSLNTSESTNKLSRTVESDYYYLSASKPSANSISYNQSISFASSTSATTKLLKFYSNHVAVRVRGDDVEAKWYKNKKIDIDYYYRASVDGTWYKISFTKTNCCTNTQVGYSFQHSPSINPYGKFVLKQGSSGVESFNLKIWTTYTW
ncbi:MAG: hypothetical protein IJC90_03790 [Clostridia bacterium]|jgi:hypothetical protein|nr:hypothetical protein [Clostridia bacterium]